MAPRYMSDHVKLLLTLKVLLMFVISTTSTKQCTSKKAEREVHVIKNIGIKLCHLKCAEHGQCASIEYDAETLTCRLLRDESKVEKNEGHFLARSPSHVRKGFQRLVHTDETSLPDSSGAAYVTQSDPTDSCKCSFGQRCLKTRSGKQVCVKASTTDASEDVTPSETDLLAPVTTQNCDPHATPSPADRRLFSASVDGDLEKVKRILSAGHVNINTRPEGSMTPVMWAAFLRHSDVVEFLVGRGADVTLVNKHGNNILHLACHGGDLETVKLILSLNVLDINSRGYLSMTPVMAAAKGLGSKDLVKVLVGRGADVSLVNKFGDNILHLACENGYLETVKFILSLNLLDINARNNDGKTAADRARIANTVGHHQILDLLQSLGAH